MITTISRDFVKCGHCQSHFPKAWLLDLKKSGAAKLGPGAFCSQKCKDSYLATILPTLVGTAGNPILA